MTLSSFKWIGVVLAAMFVADPVRGIAGGPPVIQALLTHRDYLRALALGKVGMERIVQLLDGSIADDMPVQQRIEAINGVADIGGYAWGSWVTTGFIEDETATRVLGAGLLDEDAKVREQACRQLERLGRDRYLAMIATEIKQAAERLPRECGGRLLGRLNLGLSETLDLLGRSLDVEVRARLGDVEWEQKLIAAFEQARDFRSKEQATRALGYVGTRAAGTALVHALRSPIFDGSGPGDRVSIRIPIIFALGRIHQDELLLTNQILWLQNVGDKRFGGPTAVAAYLEQVYAWAQATYGVDPEGPEPGPFLSNTEKSPAIH